MKVLELFAGTRSIGKAFENRGHQVFSVEWDKNFENIDLYADILTVTTDEILNRFWTPGCDLGKSGLFHIQHCRYKPSPEKKSCNRKP